MKKNDLLKEIKKAQKILKKDYDKFIGLFSKEPIGTLTRLNRTLSRIVMLLEANKCKSIEHPNNKVIENGLFTKTGCLVKIRADVPPCAKAVVENCHSLQQLKAEIAAVLKEAVCMSFDGIESYELSIIAYEKLRQLTAV